MKPKKQNIEETVQTATDAVEDVAMSASAVSKEQIRNAIANVYDIQKLRIASGNRLVASFYMSLGIKPSEKKKSAEGEDGENSETDKVINAVRKEYGKITDGVVNKGVSVKKMIAELNKEDDGLKYIRDQSDYSLVEAYMLLLESEEKLIKVLDKFVKQHPMWDAFFSKVKGCGTLMSAVCIAYLDPYKARHVSCFFKYCGLDSVQNLDAEGNRLWLSDLSEGDKRRILRQKFYYITEDGMTYDGKAKETTDFDSNGDMVYLGENGEVLRKEFCTKMVSGSEEPVYEDVDTGEEYVGKVCAYEHGRRKGDTVIVNGVDKDGNPYSRRSLSYNPILKTKLCGVLAGCLLKAKDPLYSSIYYDFRNRLDNSAFHKDKTLGHKNRMAIRYMIKQFLRDMWVTWRDLEGLEVDEPYEVAKLGNKPHQYNSYQCEVARRYGHGSGGVSTGTTG